MAKQTQPPIQETILHRNMEDVMHDSMLPYAEHVILERALPRVEDGLKPVQRRVLFTMLELGLTPDKPHRKSARIVGDCLGKYHPHGDSSVYDAMVRMAQPFNMCVPLVDGHGNFGSIDGDSAAAMRYTEARMTPAAMQLLRDIDKDTVSFSFNFDDTLKEPDLLPGRFPNLLVNGASGIAVGLATNIPPHNPGEAIDAVIAQMEQPEIGLKELMELLPAPDFPTGGYLLQSEELEKAYETGRGKLTMRAKTHFETLKNGRTLIVIDEIPYGINKAYTLQKILEVTQEKKALFAPIADIRDESDRMGLRAVIEVKKDGEPEKILQYLFKYSDLQCTFGVNMVAIADGRPQQMGLKTVIGHYIRHQREVVTRRTKFELETALKREHILEGLMVAVNNLDRVIRLIRAAKNPKEARESLMAEFALTEIQAQAILDLRLQRLTNLELLAIEKEYAEIQALIKELRAILASDKKLIALIKKELLEVKKQLMRPRRTQVIADESPVDLPDEKAVLVEDAVVTVLEDLKIRRFAPRFAQNLPAEEKILFRFDTRTDRKLRLFTDRGAMITLSVSDLPETKPANKPVNLAALAEFETGETIVSAFLDENDGEYLFYTRNGNVKRTGKSEYDIRAKRTAAIVLKDGDALMGVETLSLDTILLVSRLGMCIRFLTETVPAMGRVSGGVKCMKLEAKDALAFAGQCPEDGELLLVSDRGYAKRCLLFDYELQGRNGKGVKTFDFKKNGSNGTAIVGGLLVTEEQPFTVTQRHGLVSTFSTESVRIDQKAGKGFLLVAVVLDDDVVKLEGETPAK